MSQTVLVIDDDPSSRALLPVWLQREGFVVVTAEDGIEGIRKARRMSPDLIILDVMMPKVDGWVTYRQLRHACSAPIIFLTARACRDDIAKGLALGADDYLTKPYTLHDLSARIRRVLEQHPVTDGQQHVLFDDGRLRIDLMDGASLRGGRNVEFSPTESRLLLYLARHRGQTIPPKELLVQVWGPEFAGEEGYLEMFVSRLRQKIEDDPAHPRYIRTHCSEGYLLADVYEHTAS